MGAGWKGTPMKRLGACLCLSVLILMPALGGASETDKLRESFETAVAALNKGNIDGFLANIHDKAL